MEHEQRPGLEIQRLSDFIRSNRERIVEAWVGTIRVMSSSRQLPTPALIDHIPELIRRLADSLEEAAEGRPALALGEVPGEHAVVRLEEGLDLQDVVYEYLALRSTIQRLWAEEHPGGMDRGTTGLLDAIIDQAVARSVEQFTRIRDRTWLALSRISDAAVTVPEGNSFLQRLLEVLLETTESVDSVAILLRDGDLLRLRATVGLERKEGEESDLRVGEGFAGTIASRRQPMEIRNASVDPLVKSELMRRSRIRALYGVPLLRGDEVIGVAHMGSRSTFRFSEEDRLLFRTTAERATALIVQAELVAKERESRSLLDLVLAASPVGVAILDKDLRYVRVNEALARFNRTLQEAHTGRRPGEMLEPELGKWAEDVLRQVLETGEPRTGLDFETSEPGNPGRRRFYKVDLYPVRSADGTIAGVGGVVVDVTDLALATREAQRRAAELEAVLQSLPEAVYVGDMSGIKRANDMALEQLGFKNKGELDRPVPEIVDRIRSRDAVTGEPLSVEEHPFVKGLKGESVTREVLIRNVRTGQERILRSSAAPVRLEGKVIGAIAINVDITEPRRASQELRDREERIHLALEAAGTGLFDDDLLTGRTEWDERARHIFGVEPGTPLRSERVLAAIHPDDRQLVSEALLATLDPRRRAIFRVEHRIVTPEGMERWAAVQARCLFDRDGRPRRLIGAVQDITERRRSEEDLKRTANFREQFIGVLGHDLQNPLAAIEASVGLLLRQNGLRPGQVKGLLRIAGSAERMSRMIADVLDFARGRLGGTFPIQPSYVDLHDVARRVVDELHVANPDRELRLTAHGNCRGIWDPDRVAQVVSNLVANALAHGSEDEPVRVELRGEDDRVILSVKNRGKPISSELLPVIFEPFRGVSDWAEPGRRGLGLGLYIVRLIVDAHGGTVAVRSDHEETTFEVQLPRPPE